MFSLYCKYNICGPDVLILHTRACLESLHHVVTPKIKETKEKLSPKISSTKQTKIITQAI